MKRFKRHKVKTEMPETSTSHNREKEEHDLAYYIHDRVELMHQVFSVLKYKELKAMAPACVRNISVDDLQELCTEELLGISSKRLCAILDGAEPPSDTESSSQSATEPLETISLDSISSDEEILSQEEKSKKKKHKHRRRDSKSKSKRKRSKDDSQPSAEKSTASRAGLTVLELLELQARARAIRAQLQQEHTVPVTESAAVESTHSNHTSEDEVEIKEEPAEVVEISSDEEKPKIEDLEIGALQQKSTEPQSKTITKRVNDLVITVPQPKTQKIKLNRNKSVPQDTNINKNTQNKEENIEKQPEKINKDVAKDKTKKDKTKDVPKSKENPKKDKSKDKSKKKKKQRLSNASDNDEITLQLSDTEKMDLLEDLDRKNYDNVSSDTSSDSETDAVPRKTSHKHTDTATRERHSRDSRNSRDEVNVRENRISRDSRKSKDETDGTVEAKQEISIESDNIEGDADKTEDIEVESVEIKEPESVDTENVDSNIENPTSVSNSQTDVENVDEVKSEIDSNDTETVQSVEIVVPSSEVSDKTSENGDKAVKSPENDDENTGSQEDINDTEATQKDKEKDLSEGELSDRESSEVEAFDLKPEVVCISDEEDGKHKKKKKKKDKKSKKEKKSKKKDFHESVDQNFHNVTDSDKIIVSEETTENNTIIDDSSESQIQDETQKDKKTVEIDLTTERSQDCSIETNLITNSNSPDIHNTSEIEDDSANDIVEISDVVYELSDDSSNDDEAEASSVLSKEPTASEIEALSAKIDEIERVEVITAEEIDAYESQNSENKSKNDEEITISWKDRYLDSKKVKKVLNTSNILNALRKKNRELKRRLLESKIESQEVIVEVQEMQEIEIAEGSIEQYNTLEGSTTFVDPVKEMPINDTLKKDAKQLLKMYKKLLKYNDMSRKKDPSKKKKKKKGKKDKEKEQESVEDNINV